MASAKQFKVAKARKAREERKPGKPGKPNHSRKPAPPPQKPRAAGAKTAEKTREPRPALPRDEKSPRAGSPAPKHSSRHASSPKPAPAPKAAPAPKPAPAPRPAPAPKPKKKLPVRRGPTRCGRIAILGRPNVGKSTLLNALVGERIAITSHHPQTTRNNLAGYFVRGATQFVFIDTPGIHNAKNALGSRMNAFAEGEASQADVVLFVTDLREGAPLEDAVNEVDVAIAKKAASNGVPMVVAINKIDRVKEKAKLLPLLQAFGEAFPDAKALVPISGRTQDGLDALTSALEEHLPEAPFAYGEDELTDRPARYFVSEFIREQVLKRTRQEVPHGVAVMVERFDDSKPTLHVDVVIYVDKDSHRPIILGRGGLMLKEIGTSARLRLEDMLERKVHLAIVVRVDPRWYERTARLSELGYET